MATNTTSKSKKMQSAKRQVKKAPTIKTVPVTAGPLFKRPLVAIRRQMDAYLARRPHRSFRRTRRRDYARSLSLPGYWTFSNDVLHLLRRHWKLFGLLVLAYAALSAIFVGIASQESYSALTDTLKSTGDQVFDGNWGELGKASLLFIATVSGSISPTPDAAQQVTSGLIALLTWLTVVWLLRNILAGHAVRLRDGIYSSASPLVSTFVVTLVLIVQLLPLALALIGYSAAQATGLLSGGVEAMLFWVAASLLALLSLYWVTSTLIALVVVTLPGMYPLRAVKTAGDLVIGRRLRILLRWLWMLLGLGLFWVLIMIPIILLDTWLKSIWPAIDGVPTIPIVLLVMSSLSIVWVSSYVYLLYRKVVDDDAKPA